jgi:hypothetical protein
MSSTTAIFHMRDVNVGDSLVPWGDEIPSCVVTKKDERAKEIEVEFLRDDAATQRRKGERDVFPWDSKRSRGYNKVKVVVEEYEIGDDVRRTS